MGDGERLTKMLKGSYPCVLIVTDEEPLARRLVTEAALNNSKDILLWSMTDGVRDGTVKDGPSIADTENPCAGLLYY